MRRVGLAEADSRRCSSGARPRSHAQAFRIRLTPLPRDPCPWAWPDSQHPQLPVRADIGVGTSTLPSAVATSAQNVPGWLDLAGVSGILFRGQRCRRLSGRPKPKPR